MSEKDMLVERLNFILCTLLTNLFVVDTLTFFASRLGFFLLPILGVAANNYYSLGKYENTRFCDICGTGYSRIKRVSSCYKTMLYNFLAQRSLPATWTIIIVDDKRLKPFASQYCATCIIYYTDGYLPEKTHTIMHYFVRICDWRSECVEIETK